ncbi:hypothetical protein AKJ09_03282 [Labilithrix luteola]|uniref:Uncharacterized protein n=1 Tax=Labilithrix luteola TaxID=1391654 RepID=A0A0K1PSV6_9BACT|nr:hypothetical protein AKJ09_03282 [Labilithrix luteola]
MDGNCFPARGHAERTSFVATRETVLVTSGVHVRPAPCPGLDRPCAGKDNGRARRQCLSMLARRERHERHDSEKRCCCGAGVRVT